MRTGLAPAGQAEAAARFQRAIERSLEWAASLGKFHSEQQRCEVIALFRQGLAVYQEMAE